MHAHTILAVLALLFLAAAARRLQRDSGRVAPASTAWLLIGGIFALIGIWLRMR
ncbi:MAG TPA: hypothetical protein VF800_28630 [Telluria sp.]|jgi:hypothetical protein